MLDEAHKSAAPLRESLGGAPTRHWAAAVQGSESQEEIDAAAKDYGAAGRRDGGAGNDDARPDHAGPRPRAARRTRAAVRSAFFLMRGIFLDNKKWDEVPDARGY